jgi:hypothetical protein
VVTVSGASAQFHAMVEEDLDQERAGALGRAGRRLGAAVADCAGARVDVETAARRGDRRAVEEAELGYRLAYDRYLRAHRDFCIQREANRLHDQSLVDRFYPPPPPPSALRQ